MAKINFKEFPVLTGIEKKESVTYDIREQLSDLLYKRGDGMVAHTLCHIIYESTGEIELEQQQVEYLIRFAEKNCTPAMIDSLNNILTNSK